MVLPLIFAAHLMRLLIVSSSGVEEGVAEVTLLVERLLGRVAVVVIRAVQTVRQEPVVLEVVEELVDAGT